MQPQPWPDWMDEAGLLAKSADFGGDSLAKHTWDVLARLSDQVRLRPTLSQIAGERLWSHMYWGCFLHDFGKAAQGFQQVLRGQTDEWKEKRQRHEALSLAFVDWLFPKGHPDRAWVIAIIAFHHKDSPYIHEMYGGKHAHNNMGEADREAIEVMLKHLATQISEETSAHLWRWLKVCGTQWATELAIPLIDPPAIPDWEVARNLVFDVRIFKALREFHQWQTTLSHEDRMRLQIYRGLIFTADHSASAGAGSFPAMPALSAARPLSGRTWKQHQHAAAEAGLGSALLVAPTGSGKTEAALLWVERQMSQRPAARIFYTLPYQASMNAMVARLLRDYFSPDERAPLQLTDDANQVVTIQHSRALLKFYQDMLEAEQTDSGRTPRQRTEEAKRRKNLARLNYYPVQVFSPYQMLKAAYSLKGYEALLVDYADALFVFDEIHAYDPKRLALIIGLMGWLAEHLRARFLIMTATLPPLIAEALDAAIPHLGRIQASDEDFRASQRHRAFIRQGHLLGNIVAAVSEDIAAGRSVLVCCNRVADAQAAYHLLRQLPQLTAGDTLLMLHGRFNGRDRAEKERRILESVGVGNPKRTPFVLVATQVVEVSLNVDFDTLYTDPAPLEALLQRFGRVNRGRGHSPLHPVYVFEQPNDPSAKSPYAPYAADLVLAGLEVLRERDGQPIDESLVSDMLSSIYHGEIAERWRGEYQASLHEFQAAILGKMQPFMSADKALQDSFYSMFDGVQVVPTDCLDAYQDALEEGRFLEASAYTVNISWGQYHQCFQRGLILKPDSEREFYPHIDVPYSSETGLDIAAAVQQKDEAE